MSAAQPLEHDWFPHPLPANVTIGERSWLYSSYAFLRYASERPSGVRIANDTGVYYGTFFDLGPAGEVSIGPYSTVVGPVIAVNSPVEIGAYAWISWDVVIADSPWATPPGARAAEREARGESGDPSVVLHDNVWVGTRGVILAGANIGEGSVVGAGTVVDFEVPPYSIVAGNPARVVGDTRESRRPS